MLLAGQHIAALLFFPGSRPLYAQLLSLLHSMPGSAKIHRTILGWISALTGSPDGTTELDVPAYLAVALPNGTRFPVASVASALSCIPLLKDSVAQESMQLFQPLTAWLRSTVNTSVNNIVANTEVQEQCQDVVKMLLVLLQRAQCAGGVDVSKEDVCAAVDVACSALRSAALPREGLTMLGSLLWEAWALPQSSPETGAALLGGVLSSQYARHVVDQTGTQSYSLAVVTIVFQ